MVIPTRLDLLARRFLCQVVLLQESCDLVCGPLVVVDLTLWCLSDGCELDYETC